MAIATVSKPIEIHLLDGQAAILTDFTSSVLAAIAGTGGGKTILGYWWLHSRMEAYPGNTWAMAEPTYNMLSKIILVSSDPARPTLEEYLSGQGHHPRWISKKDQIIGTDWGQIYLGSADNPDSMQGAAVKGFWLDEPGLMKQLAYQTVSQRVAMMRGQILLTTTPYNLGWLKTDIADKSGSDGIHVERWRSIDRPGFPLERYEEEKRRLPPWRFAMIYDALFERPAGMIYQSFNEKVCLINRFPIPPQWLIYTGHDFGTANPAALFYAQNPTTGELFLFAEYLPGAGRSAPQHVKEWQKIAEGHNVIKRVGGSHQEEEIRQLYTAHGWVINEPKDIHTEPQIEKVIGLHALNKVFVFNDMKNYLDEKRTFSRKIDDSGKPTEAIEDEANYHLMACFIAGTKIKTINSDKAIEEINNGDLVATRQGYCPVIEHALTQIQAQVYEVSFSNGVKLTGTANHPIFVKGKGFIPLATVRYNDIIEVWKEKQLYSTGSLITDTPNQREGQTDYTSVPLSTGILRDCIRPFGNITTAIYRRIAKFITKTKTQIITTLATLNARWLRNILSSTITGEFTTSLILTESGPWLPYELGLSSTHQRVRQNGLNGEKQLSPVVQSNTLFANGVKHRLITKELKPMSGFVPIDAKRLTVKRHTLTMKLGCVLYAVKSLLSTSMRGQRRVQENAVLVLEIKAKGRAPVYNLTVDTVHEYYANGVLVHNCERYILSDFTPETIVSGNKITGKRY